MLPSELLNICYAGIVPGELAAPMPELNPAAILACVPCPPVYCRV